MKCHICLFWLVKYFSCIFWYNLCNIQILCNIRWRHKFWSSDHWSVLSEILNPHSWWYYTFLNEMQDKRQMIYFNSKDQSSLFHTNVQNMYYIMVAIKKYVEKILSCNIFHFIGMFYKFWSSDHWSVLIEIT
jgi:hypothetical protein